MGGSTCSAADSRSPRRSLLRAVSWSGARSSPTAADPFPGFLAAPLARRCEVRKRDELVFVGPDDGVLRSGDFRRSQFAAANAACQAAGPDFPSMTPHNLRHTAASLAVSACANVKAVQRMLRHASAAMTLEVYAVLFDDDLGSAAIALN